jgi:hypothetical protein
MYRRYLPVAMHGQNYGRFVIAQAKEFLYRLDGLVTFIISQGCLKAD